MDLLPLRAWLAPCLDSTTLRRLTHVVAAMLSMTGRVTMRGLSRWTGKGGRYRTVQRFFNTAIPWEKAQWFLIRRHLRTVPGAVLLTGDAVVTAKAGRDTHGLGRFCSSIHGQPIPGLCHLCLSLVPVSERLSHPGMTLPVQPPEKVPAPAPPPDPPQKRSRGRPQGSRNRVHREVELTAPHSFLRDAIQSLLALVGATRSRWRTSSTTGPWATTRASN